MNESFNSSEIHNDSAENGLEDLVDRPTESYHNWQVNTASTVCRMTDAIHRASTIAILLLV